MARDPDGHELRLMAWDDYADAFRGAAGRRPPAHRRGGGGVEAARAARIGSGVYGTDLRDLRRRGGVRPAGIPQSNRVGVDPVRSVRPKQGWPRGQRRLASIMPNAGSWAFGGPGCSRDVGIGLKKSVCVLLSYGKATSCVYQVLIKVGKSQYLLS